MKNHYAVRQMKKSTTFEIDIAEEFKEVKNAISKTNESILNLKEEINGWKNCFDRQLDKLNTNMEKALSAIADHEGRISKLEMASHDTTVKETTVDELKKFGWWAAKATLVAVLYLVGSGKIVEIIQAVFPA